jgi:CRISPR-associated protein Cas5d
MPEAIKENRDLGIMFYDIDYESDKQESLFFRAKMDEGIIIVPHKDSEEILR